MGTRRVEPKDNKEFPDGIAPNEHESNGYPYWSGDFIVIGPECFSDSEKKVISWRGENYYTAEEAERLFHSQVGDKHVPID